MCGCEAVATSKEESGDISNVDTIKAESGDISNVDMIKSGSRSHSQASGSLTACCPEATALEGIIHPRKQPRLRRFLLG